MAFKRFMLKCRPSSYIFVPRRNKNAKITKCNNLKYIFVLFHMNKKPTNMHTLIWSNTKYFCTIFSLFQLQNAEFKYNYIPREYFNIYPALLMWQLTTSITFIFLKQNLKKRFQHWTSTAKYFSAIINNILLLAGATRGCPG